MRTKLLAGAVLTLSLAVLSAAVYFAVPREDSLPPVPEDATPQAQQGVESSQDTTRKAASTDQPVQPEDVMSGSENKVIATTPAAGATAAPPVARVADDKKTIITEDGASYPLRTYRTQTMPNDPNAQQWWTANAKLDETWQLPSGSNPTLLAIIDTGFALEHEEFTNRWYANSGEQGAADSELASRLNCTDRSLPIAANCNLIDDDYDSIVDNETGSAATENPSQRNCTDQSLPLTRVCNLLDDDGNGLIDDVRGWDFIHFDNSPQAGEINPDGDGVHHGSYVAGAAAATGNNGKGLAGADWNTKILPLQALDDDSYGNSLSVARAIRYAAAQGADVISISLGTDLGDNYMRNAVRDAIAAGSVVVAAAGNDGCDCMVYPARYPEVVSVGALASDDQPASFSSYGSNLDVLAPGVGFYTTDWRSGNRTSAYASGIGGTSLATPVVSGTLTRMLSHQPEANALQLIAALTENVRRSGLATDAVRNNTLGFGRLDSLSATQRMRVPVNVQQLYAFGRVSGGGYVSSSTPAEADVTTIVYDCGQQGGLGTTPLLRLYKTTDVFFTLSQSEAFLAEGLGYDRRLFSYACVQQPHDTVDVLRTLNVLREFDNGAELKL